jgi:hypothetical protein
MQIHTLDKATTIHELQLGTTINQAINQSRRRDFALLLALLSQDVAESTPTETLSLNDNSEASLRKRFAITPAQQLRSDQDSYSVSAQHSSLFHSGSLTSTKLSHYLKPEPLTYLPEDTHDFPEDLYHNLSGHSRRQLAGVSSEPFSSSELYNQLITNNRTSQLTAYA